MHLTVCPFSFISTLMLIWKYKRLQIAKAILSEKNRAGSITIPNLKLYYRPIAIKQHGTSIKTGKKTNGTE
jgi:hypothetical protein